MVPDSSATARTESPVQKTPVETLLGVGFGYIVAQCLHAAADFGVADALDETLRSPEELTKAIGVDAGALGRILRLLSAHGVFEHQGGRYRHSPASRLLRETGEGKVSEEWVGEASVLGFWDFLAAAEKALDSKPGWCCILRRSGVHYRSAAKSKWIFRFRSDFW